MRASSRPEAHPRLRAVLLIIAASAGCDSGRSQAVDPTSLRPVIERAVARFRLVDPEAAHAVEELRKRAEEATAAAGAAPWWRHQQTDADAAWAATVNEAARRTAALARDSVAARAHWQASLAVAQAELDRARLKILTPGMGRDEAAALRRAEILLGSAHELAATDRLWAAASAAERACTAAAVVERRWLEEHDRFADPERRGAWRKLVQDGVSASKTTRSHTVIVDKLGRRLLLFDSGTLVLTVPAELGANGLQRKLYSGDRATPEGSYRVSMKKRGSSTRYHKALLLNYPNPEDLRRFSIGQEDGTVPVGAGPGNLIEIHGGGGSGRDWTDGCVALTDTDMDRIFDRVREGTPVIIVGTIDLPEQMADAK